MKINSVIRFLDEQVWKDPPAKCFLSHLNCACNNSVFSNTNYILREDTA